jgi:hypothetical protein
MRRVWEALVPWLTVAGAVVVIGLVAGWIESIGT